EGNPWGGLERLSFSPPCVCLSPGFAPVTIETSRHMYEYVATALDWWHADRYCEQRFAQLLFEPQDGEQASFRDHIVPVLVFRDKTDTKYVKVLSDFPALPAVTACAHLQWDTRTQEIATIFSYAVPAFINEFQLRGFVDEEGFVRFALIVHGHHSPYLPVFRADGQWHHFCVTWQQENGTWAIYADGKRRASANGLCAVGPSAPQAIYGQGTFIIGQDQDSLGGTFKEKESFSGNITDLHVWQKVLGAEQIEKVRSCWVVEQDLVFGWSSKALEVESTVEEVRAQFLCPGESHRPHCFSSLLQWGVSMQGQPEKPVPSLGNLVHDVQDMNLSVALGALDVLATVLREGETPVLESSDLLAVLQLLKQVSDVEVQEAEELEMLEQLGQYYVEVTELILEEQNIETWSSVSQVTVSPAAWPLSVMAESRFLIHMLTLDPFSCACLTDKANLLRHRMSQRGVHVETSLRSFSSFQLCFFRENDHLGFLLKWMVISMCVLWFLLHVSPDAGGMWSTAGCSVVTPLPDSTTCFCNHTTNFAVLLQVYEMQRTAKEELTLQTLTFIGCGVSFCALIVTFILFLAVGVPKSERTTVHKNLIFALAAAEALLMVSELAKTNQVVCYTVTAFLHLFFMAAFSWMLVEGLLLWSKVVAVNMSEDRRMKFYYVTGWGLPVVIVGVTLATSFNKYVADNHCWLNVQTNVIWAFVGPVLFILAVNTFVLFRVVMVTVSSARRRSKMLTPNSSLENQIGIQIWATAKPILVLLPVLGLTWVCGVLVHLSIVWAYVFIVLNSLQVSPVAGGSSHRSQAAACGFSCFSVLVPVPSQGHLSALKLSQAAALFCLRKLKFMLPRCEIQPRRPCSSNGPPAPISGVSYWCHGFGSSNPLSHVRFSDISMVSKR
uniref:Adhesion G protein-coupled receptor D2 n=1 Tax=Bubo bubo TaxID=30461 RepID=A0A8C0EQ32_BUBBB